MAPRPTAERPPSGLNSHWSHVWDNALDVLKKQGTWSWELSPLLTEYVLALRAAEATRDGFAWLDALERYAGENSGEVREIAWSTLGQIAGALPTQWDRHAKRAAALADQLALTPRGRRAIGLVSDDDEAPADPFADLDELAARRAS